MYSAKSIIFILGFFFAELYLTLKLRNGVKALKTLYIDVYFLINFTVDLLSLYFGALFAKVKSSVKRLVVASVISAIFACVVVLTDIKGLLYVGALVTNAVVITLVFCGKITPIRQVKLFIAFLVFETFIGGFVAFIYSSLDRYFYPLFDSGMVGAENRKLLLLALLIIITYGILRLILIVFSSTKTETNAKIKISILGKETVTEALVDSGNLVCDPIDSSAVVIVKRSAISDLIGNKCILEDEKLKTKIRIVPTKTVVGEKILIGIKSDYISIEMENLKFENTTIAIDEEEGTFGGYSALLPSCFIEGT